jgi:hypothetical protein
VSDINEAAQGFAGEWVKLTHKADGVIEGRVTYFEKRPALFKGKPIMSQKTGAQRYEWVLAVQDDDNRVVKFSLPESGQRTVAAAITDSGQSAKIGDRIKIRVTKDSVQGESQADYEVRWTPSAAALGIPETAQDEPEPDEEPF